MCTHKRPNVLALASLLSAVLSPVQVGSEELKIKSVTLAVKLTWDGGFSHAYQVWCAISAEGPWQRLGGLLEGSDGEMYIYYDISGDKRFYRIEALSNIPPGMVPVPGGTYQMGDHFGTGSDAERPVHTVGVDSFFMDAREVTNAQYCTFLNSIKKEGVLSYHSDTKTVHGPAPLNAASEYLQIGFDIVYDNLLDAFRVKAGRDEHPVVDVYWIGAVAYCNWRSRQEGLSSWFEIFTGCVSFAVDGYRLPTEAEWEYAARADLRYSIYPWGNELDLRKANFNGSGDPYEEEYPATTPTGYYPPNSYGLFDMAGNASELCYDSYGKNYYLYCVDNSIVDNPTGPIVSAADVKFRVVRGGSWETGPGSVRCSARPGLGQGGFRCVRRPRSTTSRFLLSVRSARLIQASLSWQTGSMCYRLVKLTG